MTGDEASEALAIIRRIGPVVLSAAPNMTGSVGVSLRRAVGMLITDYNMVHPATFGIAFAVCLDLVRHCAATLTTMDRIRLAALSEQPKSLAAVSTVLAIVRLTLAAEGRIIAFMEFRSREDVEEIATVMNDAFNQAAETASDYLDAGNYMALIASHGDVVKHLADRGRLLPRVINYTFEMVMPALRLSQRAYADPKRYRELLDENHVVHPAFMPRDGKMLAV